jgi:hypothetical protein
MIPLTCGMSLCSSNCPRHKGWVYLFPHTCKTKTKRIIKITNPKNNIEETKRKGKKTNNKKNINKIFKNYKKKKFNFKNKRNNKN